MTALNSVDLEIASGEFSVVVGPSGSGKTTLLNLIGCVDTASCGDVFVAGQNTKLLNDKHLTDLRLHTIGFIFQSFNLISVLNVYDNVEFPLLLMKKWSSTQRKEKVMYFLKMVGLENHWHHRPSELSGGQRQRVAIARALVTQPKIVLADEPTANLDSETGRSIIELMKDINMREKTTFLFSTHDAHIMQQARRLIFLQDGRITSKEAIH